MARNKKQMTELYDDEGNVIETHEEAIDENVLEPEGLVSVEDRLPKDIKPGQTLYIRATKQSIVRADKVKAIVIREDNVGILFYSGIEVNAQEIGNIVLLKEPNEKK